jgi:hypothetical protein
LCLRQRRSEQFESIGAVNSRVVEVLALLRWLRVIAEKGFHFASGCENNQQFPGTIAHVASALPKNALRSRFCMVEPPFRSPNILLHEVGSIPGLACKHIRMELS